jgi:phospholipid-binding lipoprotein MlaA
MQGDMENAALGTFEFLINGLTLGLVDLTDDGDTPRSTNFDDTLAYYQAEHGFYIVLPVLGPGTVRSHTGWVVNSLTNPFHFATTPAAATISAVNTPVRIVTFRGNNFEYINDIKYQSLDAYARVRSIYLQYDHADENQANEDKEDVFDSFIEATE